MIYICYKNCGQTPLQVIHMLRNKLKIDVSEKITYAGRLDPAAEGLLILLTGEDRFKKEEYIGLDKKYDISFIVGFRTDTYDLLGVVTYVDKNVDKHVENYVEKLKEVDISSFNNLPYPPYSSKTKEGKPLWLYARELYTHNNNTLSTDLSRLLSTSTVISFDDISGQMVKGKSIYDNVVTLTSSVEGDFRQKDIFASWKNALDMNKEYVEISCTIHCTSGTYMRAIVNKIGDMFGKGAVTTTIKRIQIGDYIKETVSL